jgi:hypothetical protein
MCGPGTTWRRIIVLRDMFPVIMHNPGSPHPLALSPGLILNDIPYDQSA